ncbi:hypothetical protein W02_02590 [Nitrospira sp. KM1]|nr:hypothetical protein W02_02590 [Nitrospira sp. KM1]
MRVIRFFPIILICLLTGAQVLLHVSRTDAGHICCAWNKCSYFPHCSCPGQGNCPYMRSSSPNQDALQAYTPISDVRIDIRTARSLDSTDRLSQMSGLSDCARQNSALSILRDAGKPFEVRWFDMTEETTYDSAALIEIAVNVTR